MKSFAIIWIFVLFRAPDVLGVITPPKIIYGGWKPILPGDPFYFGPRDNHIPSYAAANAHHQYIEHGEPLSYVEELIQPTKYTILPENILQNVKHHAKKDIFSYYPHSGESPAREIGYKPFYLELPRKPLDIFENPATQTPSSLQHHLPQHNELFLQKPHQSGNELYGQTYLKITPLVDANGTPINSEDVHIEPYLVPLPPRTPVHHQLVHKKSVRQHIPQQQLHHSSPQHGSNYFTEVQYIEQNEVPVNEEPVKYEEQVVEVPVEVPQHIIEQPMYQNDVDNAFTPRALKSGLGNNYVTIHQNQGLSKHLSPQNHIHISDTLKNQYARHFQKQPIIYQIANHDNNYKTQHQQIIQVQQQNHKPRFVRPNTKLPSKFRYQISDNKKRGFRKLFLNPNSGQYRQIQHNGDISAIQIQHKERVPTNIVYEEVEVNEPKPVVYHVQSNYKNAEPQKQVPEIGEGELAIINIPLNEYLRLKAQENLLRKDAVVLTSDNKHSIIHHANDYQIQHSSDSPQYEQNHNQPKQKHIYSNSQIFIQEEGEEKGNVSANSADDNQNSNGNSNSDNSKNDQQIYHAYYAPADHDPPEGYVKMSVKEFNRMFKNAEIRYVDKEPSISDLTKENNGVTKEK